MRRGLRSRWLPAAVAGLMVMVACAQTDAGLTTKIKTKLAADDTVKAYQIDVDTKEKVVTLTGSVDSQAAKDQAIALARSTAGVVDVVDNITVSGPGGTMEGMGEPAMGTTPGMEGTPAMETTPPGGTTPIMAMTTPGPRR
ncbi:MAG: BON domain-containing protein [Thermoanaerobaculia bacterium]